MRNQYIRDEGGNSYIKRKGYAVKLGEGLTVVHRCESCGTKRTVSKLELARSARPRCLNCGGCLAPCEAELHRTRDQRQTVERPRLMRCRACGAGFQYVEGLKQHLAANTAGCEDDYRREGYPKP